MSPLRWMRRHYGAGPLHLLSLVACFAVAGYAVSKIVQAGPPEKIFLWFAGAVIGHDLVLWPLYGIADRTAVRASRAAPGRLAHVPWVNHVRVPVVISLCLLAVSFPLVLRMSEGTYHAANGMTEAPYLGRYLLVIGVLFAASAVLYAVRLGRAGRRARAGRRGPQVSAAPPTCPAPSAPSPEASP